MLYNYDQNIQCFASIPLLFNYDSRNYIGETTIKSRPTTIRSSNPKSPSVGIWRPTCPSFFPTIIERGRKYSWHDAFSFPRFLSFSFFPLLFSFLSFVIFGGSFRSFSKLWSFEEAVREPASWFLSLPRKSTWSVVNEERWTTQRMRRYVDRDTRSLLVLWSFL